VKDDVSGSVEAVRNAKANQLNADANLKNAQAAAAQATADLTKATTAAQVALQTAQAASAAAQAKIDEADAQLKGDALAAELEKILADYADQTATSKASAQIQLNALAAALRTAAQSNYDNVSTLVANFRLAFNNLTAAKAALVTAKANYAKAQISSEYAEEVNAAIVKGLEDTIAEKEALLEALKKIESENPTQSSINAAADALVAQADEDAAAFDNNNEAVNKFFEAVAAWVKAYAVFDAYVDPSVTDGVIAKLNNEVNTLDPGKAYLIQETNTVDIKSSSIPFADYTSYTALAGAAGNTDINPALKKVTYNTYRVSNEGKMIMDNYLANYTDTQTKAVKAAKTAKADLEGQLGKEGDKKDTKYKDSKGVETVTLYGQQAGAQEAYDKAVAAEATAKADLASKPAAVKTAVDALIAENEKKTFDGDKWIAAVVNLADALVAAYGAPAADPNIKKYAYPANAQDAIDYLFGAASVHNETWMKDPDNIKKLFKNGDADCIVTAWASDATKKDYTEAAKVEDISNRDAKAVNVVTAYKNAQAATKTAKTALDAAKKAVADQPQKIAAAQDAIDAAQELLDGAEEKKAELKDLIAAAGEYENVVAALEAASADFNEAADAAEAARAEVIAEYAVAGAIAATTPEDLGNKIALATAALATAKENLAKAKADNHGTDGALAAAAQAVADAEAEVKFCEAEFEAAAADLEAAGIQLGEEEEEPAAEEPAEEEPAAEEPAEGEGEGE
jgi:hypothetical protein